MNSKFYDPRQISASSFSVQVDTVYKELNRTNLSDIPSVSDSAGTWDENALKYFNAAMFVSILEDAITSVNILGKCNTALSLRKTLLNRNALILKKYDIEPSSTPEDPIRYPLDCDENKIEKMITDRQMCLKMLITMYEELAANATYYRLREFLQEKETQEDNQLVNDVSENKIQYREIKKKLRSQRHVHRLALYDNEDLITRLIDVIGDTEQMSTIKHKYLSNWKTAQIEQHMKKIHDAQSKAAETIYRNRYEFEREIRAHYEVDRFNNILMADQLEKIDEVMAKYEEDIEEMDLKIQVSMSNLAAMQQKKSEMEIMLAKRQKEIDKWTKYKDERAAKQAKINKYNKAAIIVQAWWRGLLVRQKLGPFKKGKKGGRSKKKKRLSEEIE